MRQKSDGRTTPEQIVKDIRRATQKHYSAEDNILVVLEGSRGDYSYDKTAQGANFVVDVVLAYQLRQKEPFPEHDLVDLTGRMPGVLHVQWRKLRQPFVWPDTSGWFCRAWFRGNV